MIVGGKYHVSRKIPNIDTGKKDEESGKQKLKKLLEKDGRFKKVNKDIIPICTYNWYDEDDIFALLEDIGVFIGDICTGRLFALDDSKNHVEIYYPGSSETPKIERCPWEWRVVYERKKK